MNSYDMSNFHFRVETYLLDRVAREVKHKCNSINKFTQAIKSIYQMEI